MEPTPKILIVYYSRTGTTGQVANELAKRLGEGVDVEGIVDHVDRRGAVGYLRSGREALRKTTPEITPPRHDPGDYDLVVVATPVWAATMASPVRSYLLRCGEAIRRVAVLYTAHVAKYKHVCQEIAELCPQAAFAEGLGLTARQIRKGAHAEPLNAFAEALRKQG